VEGLWSSIKRLCKDFTGINISNLDKLVENGINIKDNLNDWICYALLLLDFERFKLNKISKIKKLKF